MLAADLDVFVSSYLECGSSGSEKHWNVWFNRLFNDLELFRPCLDYYPRCKGGAGLDRMGWQLRGIGMFHIRSYYGVLSAPKEIYFHGNEFAVPKL